MRGRWKPRLPRSGKRRACGSSASWPTWPCATTSTGWPGPPWTRSATGWNIPQAIDEIRDEDWRYCVELNLNSVMALTRALAPQMKERRWGRVIHISSVMALGSTPKRNVYSATKAALVGMARASALDLGPFGITVNCIAPGPIATEMPMSILSKEQQDAFSARAAVGRWGTPDELAGPALLLASDAGSYITGTVLVVDGGVTANVF